jgi:hypothetical protein
MAQIAAASAEQSQGIAQVNVAVGEMDGITQQNAANAEETASAAEELSAESLHLRSLVDQLRAVTEGSGGAGRVDRPTATAPLRRAGARLDSPSGSRKPREDDGRSRSADPRGPVRETRQAGLDTSFAGVISFDEDDLAEF